LTVIEINKFVQVDKLNILIVEAINESAYGFNLSNEVEKATAIQVVTDKDDFTVVGWSISKIIPNWVKSFDEWNIYISDQGQELWRLQNCKSPEAQKRRWFGTTCRGWREQSF